MNSFRRVILVSGIVCCALVPSLTRAEEAPLQEGLPAVQYLEPPSLPAPVLTKSASVKIDDNLADITAVGLEILDALPYNILQFLPKAKNEFPVFFGPFKDVTYGPYQIKKSLYNDAGLTLPEIDKRLFALQEVMKAAKPKDPNVMDEKIHRADLLTMKSRLTGDVSDVKASIAAYAELYQDVDSDFSPYVALNMVNSLLFIGDDITAFPIIKKIIKEPGMAKEFKRQLNNSMIELYFIAGRYQKAWSELEDRVKNKEVDDESLDYRLRIGDILFFMDRYQEASDWYQSVLKPELTKTLSENVSWLYLAEAVFQSGNADVARKIYAAVAGYFADKVYADVIDYRLHPTEEQSGVILRRTTNPAIRDWMGVELLKDKFRKDPQLFSSDSFNNILLQHEYPEALKKQVLAMQAIAFQYDKKYYDAIRLYEKLGMGSKNPDFDRLIDSEIMSALTKQGLATRSENEAYTFLRFFKSFDFRLRSNDPDQLFAVLEHNLELMGLKDLTAEMTLHIIDKSIHRPEDKTKIYLKLARSLDDMDSVQSCLKALELIELSLIPFEQKEEYYHLYVKALLRNNDDKLALETLSQWEKEGAAAKNIYWIALKKVEILRRLGKSEAALAVIEDNLGNGKVDYLPKDYDESVNPLLAQQVVLNDKLGKNFQALTDFYSNQERILQTADKNPALLAALSSALAMNKKNDVSKILAIAKDNFDDGTYKWIHEWSKVELWINQLSNYLDDHKPVEHSVKP